MEENSSLKKTERLRFFLKRTLLFILDLIVLNGAVFLALVVRFDVSFSQIPYMYIHHYLLTAAPYTAIALFLMWCFRLYHSLWRYAGTKEIYKILLACASTVGMYIFLTFISLNPLPRSVYFMQFCFLLLGITFTRFMYRLIRSGLKRDKDIEGMSHLMVIGAGDAANILIREIQNNASFRKQKIVCIIDDNKSKWGKYIRGIKVVGGRDSIMEAAVKYKIDQIIFALPSIDNYEKSIILNICKETGCELKIVPGVYQMVDGEFDVSQIRNVDVVDLLGREPIEVDLASIMDYVNNKTILVTGGGGSIGSELCRQIAEHKPKSLIIFDEYENNAYDIQQELKRKKAQTQIITLIGSVCDEKRLEDIFSKYKPDIVYHAAAHKHVPLMEDSPNEAVKNNVYGTWNTAKMANKYNVLRFVLISTDKAVNPTNVMGVTKRICEMIVQEYDRMSETEFVAVRFGNVLGSNGSVIPLFKKQIEMGGPVTVTHPDVMRYFMTIQEAISLILQAGAYAKGGEIFVLDMGKPVRIEDLARNLIRLSGYAPDLDIKIEYTGLRPGEKLFEEILMDEEGLQSTENKLIHIGKPINIKDRENFFKNLEKIKTMAYDEAKDIRPLLKQISPTYKPVEDKTT